MLPYLYARWLFWFVLGILWEIWGNGYAQISWVGFVGSLALFSVLHLFLPPVQRLKYKALLGISASATLVAFGVFFTHTRIERHFDSHFLHQTGIEAYTVHITQEPQEKERSYRAVGEVQQIRRQGRWQASRGKVLLYFRKEAGAFEALTYGNLYLVRGSPQKVPPPSNPAMFDFREYLAYQNVYHQQFLVPQEVSKIGYRIPNYLMSGAIYLRQQCIKTFEKLIEGKRESALAIALVLGIKDDVDPEVLEAYTVTGLMHILAVSGMHVGLLVVYPMRWFKRVKDKNDRKTKRKKQLFFYVMVTLLAFYALLTGLSASISRAVVMFSILLFGKVYQKRTNSYNVLALSAFILLLWEPFWILNVGFQLSYLAVVGIFYIQSRMVRWLKPRTWFMREAWGIVTVTISAQIVTTPIGLFYFHQFPNYFLISNLLALPASTIVLYLVLATLVFGWVPYLGLLLGTLASYGIYWTNNIIFFIQKMPFQLSDGIWLMWWEVVALYGFVVFFLMTWELYRTRYWVLACACLGLFTFSKVGRYIAQSSQNRLTVYNLGSVNNVAFTAGHKAYFWADSTLAKNSKTYNFNIKNHLFRQGIIAPTYLTAPTDVKTPCLLHRTKDYQIAQFSGKTILILPARLPQRACAKFKDLKVDFCVLQNRPLYELSHLLAYARVGKFVLSASNPKSYAQRLKKEADSLHIPLHNVVEDEAFVVDF